MPSQTQTQPDLAAVVAGVLKRYDRDPAFLIPMMQDLQEEAGYLPKPGLKLLSKELGVPLTRVYSVATFYKTFSMAPRGAHLITLCMGTVAETGRTAAMSLRTNDHGTVMWMPLAGRIEPGLVPSSSARTSSLHTPVALTMAVARTSMRRPSASTVTPQALPAASLLMAMTRTPLATAAP